MKRDRIQNHVAIKPVSAINIYLYEHIGVKSHEGFIKVGETWRDSEERVGESNKTSNVPYRILKEYKGVDANNRIFRDSDIHAILKNLGVECEPHSSGKDSEWFKIGFDELDRIISQRINLEGAYEVLRKKGVDYKLRDSQEFAVQKTLARYNILRQNIHVSKDDDLRKFLWNAKPRFGKSLTAYDFAKRAKMKTVLVITGRTAISQSWASDYYEFIKDTSNFFFGSSKENVVEIDGKIYKAFNKKQSQDALRQGKDLIFFVSWADVKGKDRDGDEAFKKNNSWIFENKWDLLIIDEVHESSRSDLAVQVFDALNFEFKLELSGTPFKILDAYSDKNSFTWSYEDEQRAKAEWNDPIVANPYSDMPEMNVFTFDISSKIRQNAATENGGFTFAEFFRNNGREFVHDKEIDEFLDTLCRRIEGDDSETQYYPFADEHTREYLRHTFWLLPFGDSDALMLLEEKLKRHHFFGARDENGKRIYQILVAAGKAGEDSSSALAKLEEKMTKEPWKTKTIMLSQDMLITGTTVKPWTAVLMLHDSSEKARYFQAAFRAQSPWSYEFEGDKFVKQNSYVFDFSPNRVLKVFEDYALMNAEVSAQTGAVLHGEKVRAIKEVLNFWNVIAMDENSRMKELDANEILSMSRVFTAREIVDSGFMDSRLFNVDIIFRKPIAERRRYDQLFEDKASVTYDKKSKKKKESVKSEEIESPEIKIGADVIISENPEVGKVEYSTAVIDAETGEETVRTLTRDQAIAKSGLEEKEFIKQEVSAKSKIDDAAKKRADEKKKFEDKLRSFSRGASLLFLAYAKDGMTLSNFSKYIDKSLFFDATGYTHDEFERLRVDGVLDETVWNSAITQFIADKKHLSEYYKTTDGEDIFSKIPPQENNKVFTPHDIVNLMLDKVEAQNPGIFKSSKVKFLDPNSKSGLFLSEIVRRLYKYSKDKDIYRILKEQVFAFCPDKLHEAVTREMVAGFIKNDENATKKEGYFYSNFIAEDTFKGMKEEGWLDRKIKEHFGENMKFDVVIGNPPYQEETKDTSDKPIYNYFMDEAYKVADKVCFITPARFLFNAGKTPKKWNEKMLNDEHLSVEFYEQRSDKVFPNTDIKGGVAITYRDITKNFGKIGTFTHYDELKTALRKVWSKNFSGNYLSDIYYSTDSHQFSDKLHQDFPEAKTKLSKGHEKTVASSVLSSLGDIFREDGDFGGDYKFIGVIKNIRKWRYIKKEYIEDHPNLMKFKVMLPGSNGSGAIGEVLSTPLIGEPLIGEPLIGHTQTFISFGAFETREEAEALLKYIKSKFARAMLGTLKITQSNKKDTWRNVPLQDFTAQSDIDWSKSIPEIDRQLYRKYGLDEKEIAFIEEKVREME